MGADLDAAECRGPAAAAGRVVENLAIMEMGSRCLGRIHTSIYEQRTETIDFALMNDEPLLSKAQRADALIAFAFFFLLEEYITVHVASVEGSRQLGLLYREVVGKFSLFE